MSARWTEKQVDLARERIRTGQAAPPAPSARANGQARVRAPRMNKIETVYAQELELRRLAHEIRAWRFEGMKLWCADGAYYKPDFVVVGIGGEIEIHEIKGFWREAARLRIKVAAKEHPWFRFIALRRRRKRDGGGWQIEQF